MKLILAAAAIAAVSLAASGAYADGDIEKGKTDFKKCMACHAAGEGATNRVGPVLNDVFGRIAGTFEGYKYSQAMIDKGAAGLVWDHDTLAEFLHKPRDFVPGTKMTFAGFADPADTEDLLAYLVTLSPNYVPAAPMDASSSAMDAASSEMSSSAAQ